MYLVNNKFHTPTYLLPWNSSQRSVRTRLIVAWALQSVNPQPWRFTNNSLGLPHAPSLSVCLFLWVCVVCVCFLLYRFFYLFCARCVFWVRFCIHNHLFVFFLLFLEIYYTYVTVPIDVRIHLRIWLNYIFISLNPAYVSVNMYTHFPPLPYSYTSIAIFICTVCVMFYTYTHVFVYFFLFPKLNRHLCHGVYWCNIPLWWCVRCLLITESPKTPSHYRYQI